MAKHSDNSAQGDLFADAPVGVETPVAFTGRPASDQKQPKTDPPDLTPQQLAALEGQNADNLGDGERYLKDTEVAERFGIARQTVWKRVNQGYLPAPVKLPPNSTRWRLSSLLAFEKALTVTLPQPLQEIYRSETEK
ncbi:helix-turn-helix transcriptional regulator [Shimia sp. MIT910701]|uniref:helix-turn-helix transcriptional regulator n=1 Tax=Shimia sp. MIT910701 TaxID=3096987 RepID=UPI00399AF1CA